MPSPQGFLSELIYNFLLHQLKASIKIKKRI